MAEVITVAYLRSTVAERYVFLILGAPPFFTSHPSMVKVTVVAYTRAILIVIHLLSEFLIYTGASFKLGKILQ